MGEEEGDLGGGNKKKRGGIKSKSSESVLINYYGLEPGPCERISMHATWRCKAWKRNHEGRADGCECETRAWGKETGSEQCRKRLSALREELLASRPSFYQWL